MKTYIQPDTMLIMVKVQPLLTNSIASQSGLEGVTLGGTNNEKINADSRRATIWDDEE